MMNLIKVLVPFVGLVAASNSTNGTNGTTAAAAAATTAAATTAANTTAAASNATKAASGGDDKKASGNATASVTVDVPVTISFGNHKPADIVAALPSAADLAAIEISARRLSGNGTAITKAQVKALLVASAKGFAKAIGGASADKKVSITKVEAVADGVKITFRVTLTGNAAKDTKIADKIVADVKAGSFKETLQTAVAAEVKADTTLGDAFAPTVKKIDAPVMKTTGTVPKATTKAPSSSGAVSFVAPAGAMLMAMFALF